MSDGKIIKKGASAQGEIINGVIAAVDAIKTTMGPAGRCVTIDGPLGPEVTRDGATVAKSIKFSDPTMNMGAQLVKKAASSTEASAGDGTSTTSLLVAEFCKRGQRSLYSNYNVNEIKVGMLKASNWVKEFIAKSSTAVGDDLEKIQQIATISANNDPEVGDLVVDCMSQVGTDGVITADMTSGLETYTEITTGMRIERGWSSPAYVTNLEEGTCVMNNPYIIVAGENISSMHQLLPILENVLATSRPILIICDEMAENVNATLVMNTLQGACRICVVKGIDFGDGRRNLMEDIATVVGGTHLCMDNSRTLATPGVSIETGDVGTADKVVITRSTCTIYKGAGDSKKVQERADVLRARANDPTTTDFDKMKFTKRVAGLVGGVGIIYAGGASEAEKLNRKATIEDSILASQSAMAEGYVPGGGFVFYKASQEIKSDKNFWKNLTDSEKEGVDIVVDSLTCVLDTVVKNSGETPEVVKLNMKTGQKKSPAYGFNAKTRTYGDLLKEGILDSAKVLRVAIENSVSAASMILLTDCIIIDEPTKVSENGDPFANGMPQ